MEIKVITFFVNNVSNGGQDQKNNTFIARNAKNVQMDKKKAHFIVINATFAAKKKR